MDIIFVVIRGYYIKLNKLEVRIFDFWLYDLVMIIVIVVWEILVGFRWINNVVNIDFVLGWYICYDCWIDVDMLLLF